MDTRDRIAVPLRSGRLVVRQTAGATALLVLGILAVVGSVAGPEPTTARVAGIVIGVVLLAIGALVALSLRVERADRWIVFDPVGIGWTVGGEPVWQVAWAHLHSATVHVGHRRAGGRIVDRVSLQLVPVHPAGFAAAHPQLAALRGAFWSGGRDRFGIPFAGRTELIAPLASGLHRFGGGCDGGVVDDGFLTGPGYLPRRNGSGSSDQSGTA